MKLLLLTAIVFLSSAFAGAEPSTLNEAKAKAILNEITQAFQPDVAPFGGGQVIWQMLKDEAPGATGARVYPNWMLMVSKGFIPLPDTTPDSFSVMMCHELGHMLGGSVYFTHHSYGDPDATPKKGDGSFASAEGEADYFATQVCAKRLWKDEAAENARQAKLATPAAKAACAKTWAKEADLNLCLRIVNASARMMKVLATAGGAHNPVPSLESTDPSEVRETLFDKYPETQCRLDTLVRGALCTKTVSAVTIPGYYLDVDQMNGPEAEREMRKVSCFDDVPAEAPGARPRCWFRPQL